VTFTATVTGSNAPAGNVTFYDGVTPMGTQALNGSFQASVTSSTLAIGLHTITARYLGNATNPPSDSAPLSHTVVDPRPATTTTLALASGTNPSTQGVSLTFTATVTGAAPTGNVSFYDRDRLMGTVALNGSGQASLTTRTLPWGARSLTARYAGDANNAPGVSARLLQTVNPPPGNGKLKVFLLAGQSNMQGYGKLEYGRDPDNLSGPEIPGGLGCLRYVATNNPLRYDYLLDPAHPVNGKPGWITRSDVWVSFWDGIGGDPMATTVERRNGMLDSGFGVGASLDSGLIGPEYGFGLIVGSALADPVLLIKTAWGGKSLAVDFRPPSSGNTGTNYTLMVSKMHLVLDNLATYYPGYSGAGYEIAGFGWHQGWNDRVDANFTAQYETNLANLIRDVRAEFRAPKLPFVIANTGMANAPGGPGSLIAAQFAVTNASKYPDFAGNVTTVDTRPFDYGELQSPNGFGYHWYWNGESYFNIGESMGLAMMALLSPPTPVLPGSGCVVTGGVPTFTFPTVSGFKYRLVYKSSLTDPVWSPGVWSATSIGAPLSLSDTSAVGQPQRFYRIESANP
jgi:alpha-galactosidase